MKNDLSLIISDLSKALDSSCDKILAKATDLNGYCQAKREIHKLERDLELEFREIGILAYELYKLGVAYSPKDFEAKFEKISQLQRALKDIKINETSLNKLEEDLEHDKILIDQVSPRESVLRSEDGEELIRCKACGKANPIYVASCSFCGESLE